MSEETKVVSESPVVVPVEIAQTPEVTPGEPTIISERDKAREAIEERIVGVAEPVVVEEVKVEEKVEPKPEASVDEDAKLKESVQKRINKEVAKRKTAEEELAEAKAEIERLKTAPKTEAITPQAEPTIEQCVAYIAKCNEEGNWKEAAEATRYMVKLEKEAAVKAVREEQQARNNEQARSLTKQQSDWISLNQDYSSDNPEINLSNQSSLLYKQALKLYQDPDLREVYASEDRISGFRRAVHDAHRHITENGLHKKVSERIDVTPRPKEKAVLAEPSAEAAEDTPSSSTNPSDADKVKDEILNRRRNLAPPQRR